MSQMISEKLKNELEEKVSDIAEKFSELIELMQDSGINPRNLTFMNYLGTILGGSIEGISELHFDHTFDNWVEKCEVCSDEKVTVVFVTDLGRFEYEATYNLSSDVLEYTETFCDALNNIEPSQIQEAYFERKEHGERLLVCRECLEHVLDDTANCSSCH